MDTQLEHNTPIVSSQTSWLSMDSTQAIYGSTGGHHLQPQEHNHFTESYLSANENVVVVAAEDDGGGGDRFESEASVIARLQAKLEAARTKQLSLEKENHCLQNRVQDLEKELEEVKGKLAKGANAHELSFRAIRNQLAATIKCFSSPSSSSSSKDLKNGGNKRRKRKHSENEPAPSSSSSGITRVVFVHKCDECDVFSTKSDVSLILHKMNHAIAEKQYRLEVGSFTTRTANTSDIYECPVCVEGPKMTLHEVYLHLYDQHTCERPIACGQCELWFTHQDYLDQHLRVRHVLQREESKFPSYSIRPIDSNPCDLVDAQEIPSDKAFHSAKEATQSKDELNQHQVYRCNFSDCTFTTRFLDKHEFHVAAHTNTKFKCPYCPYVANTFVDIRRHIQKSKKHEGMKVYRCRRCGFDSDSERDFREHLRLKHFGSDADDTLISYSIEQLFSNKNNPFQLRKTAKPVSASEAPRTLESQMGQQQQINPHTYVTSSASMFIPGSSMKNVQTQPQPQAPTMPQQSIQMPVQVFYRVEPSSQQHQQQQHIMANINQVTYGANVSSQEESSQMRFLLTEQGQLQHHQANPSPALHLLTSSADGCNNQNTFQVTNDEHNILRPANELHLHQQQQQQVDQYLEQYI